MEGGYTFTQQLRQDRILEGGRKPGGGARDPGFPLIPHDFALIFIKGTEREGGPRGILVLMTEFWRGSRKDGRGVEFAGKGVVFTEKG